MTLRLAFFDFNINYGGGPQGSVYLAERLKREGNEVHVIDAYGFCDLYCEAVRKASIPLHILHPGAKKVYIGSKGKGLVRLASALRQIPDFLRLRRCLIKKVLEIDPDVIWVNNEKSLVFLVSSFRLWKYPVVMYVRGWATRDQVSVCLRWLLKHKVAAIITHSRAAVEQLKRRGIAEDKLAYTQNTIDLEKVKRLALERLADTLPGTERKVKILLPAARLTEEKGHITAVKATARLKEKGLDVALWLAGQVSTGGDESFPKRLRQLAKELGVNENVYFLGWQENMPALIKACDIVILPSHTEGFPRVILEAMLLKRPVCATPVGGIPEAIEDGKTGFLFGVDNDEALASKVARLVLESSLRGEIVEQAYNFLRKELSSDDHTRVVMKVFRSAVTGKGK